MINIKKIQDRMTELKISKAQLIKNSGLTRVTIDKILSGGEINVKTLESLANGLGVSIGFFFDDEIADTTQTQAIGSHFNHAGRDINNGFNPEEHDELIRLRSEVAMYKDQIASLKQSIEDLRKMNDFLMSQK